MDKNASRIDSRLSLIISPFPVPLSIWSAFKNYRAAIRDFDIRRFTPHTYDQYHRFDNALRVWTTRADTAISAYDLYEIVVDRRRRLVRFGGLDAKTSNSATYRTLLHPYRWSWLFDFVEDGNLGEKHAKIRNDLITHDVKRTYVRFTTIIKLYRLKSIRFSLKTKLNGLRKNYIRR